MIRDKLTHFVQFLENPKHPLLGPNLKGLSFGGMWLKGPNLWICFQKFVNFFTFFFVVSQFMEAYNIRNDFNRLLQNLSITILSFTCYSKCMAFVFRLKRWSELFHSISEEEISCIQSGDKKVIVLMKEYIKYSRFITYSYWILVSVTNAAMMIAPVFKLFSSANYRKEVQQGILPYPEMLSSWFPFDNTKMPGYFFACLVHVSMCSKGAAITAVFDTNAVAIMVFLKGQMIILEEKCKNIFHNCKSRKEALRRIKECHRQHNFILRTHQTFDALLSPIMFLYVLICSMTICFSVVQYVSAGVTISYKIWIIEYTIAQVSQLFLFCWHSNDVLLEILKGAYSFFTLFSQIQE
ncbi:odorant receptor Or2 isoform X2 [Plodia interpunctella]|uniref:odorant receptor Or2 isoform X2 n=1 Tax=Plodia interpunctella TaxID=58824 RepID=UPI002367B88E|nr:odorant receptor Or2-like isoform X2 [Plodia interpunctella]